MNNLYLLPKKIKDLRESFKYTQTYMAKQLGITKQSYQAYEGGKALPKYEYLILIADIFDVSTDYLLGRKEY